MSNEAHRGWWLRSGGVLTALVLLPSFAPDLVSLSCPHHVGHEAQGPAARFTDPGVAEAAPVKDGHAGEGRPSPSSHTTHHPGEGPHEGLATLEGSSAPGHSGAHVPAPCTCVGQCPVPEPPSPPTSPVTHIGTPRLLSLVTVADAVEFLRSPATRYFQPPATAPPVPRS